MATTVEKVEKGVHKPKSPEVKGTLNVGAERGKLAGSQEVRIKAGVPKELFDEAEAALAAYEAAPPEEREALATAFKEKKEAALWPSITMELESGGTREISRRQIEDTAKEMKKEARKIRQDLTDVAVDAELEPKDLGESWTAVNRHMEHIDTALTKVTQALNAEQLIEAQAEYMALKEELSGSLSNTVKEAITSAVKKREAVAPDRSAASPEEARRAERNELLETLKSPDTTAAEREQVSARLKQIIEEDLAANAAPKAPVTDLDTNPEGRIVMMNSVLSKQAMGGKKFKKPILFPAAYVPDGVKPEVAAKQRERRIDRKETVAKSKGWFAGGSLIAAGLAAWFVSGSSGKKVEVEQGLGNGPAVSTRTLEEMGLTSTPEPVFNNWREATTPTVKVPGAKLEIPAEGKTVILSNTSDAKFDSWVADNPALATSEVPKPAAEEVKEEPRIKKPPAVHRPAKVTVTEMKQWDRVFNKWLKENYPQGYAKADTIKVRTEMVNGVGYPNSLPQKVSVPRPKRAETPVKTPIAVTKEKKVKEAPVASVVETPTPIVPNKDSGVIPLREYKRESGGGGI